MIILDVIIFKLSQKQDKRFLNSSLDVNGHFVWNRLSAELQISKNKVTVINLSIFNRPFLTRWDILMNLSIRTDVLKVQEVFRKGDYESRCLQMLIFFPYFQQSLKVLLCILRLAIVHTSSCSSFIVMYIITTDLIFSVTISMVSLLTLRFMFSFSVMILHPLLPVSDFLIRKVTHSPRIGTLAHRDSDWKYFQRNEIFFRISFSCFLNIFMRSNSSHFRKFLLINFYKDSLRQSFKEN